MTYGEAEAMPVVAEHMLDPEESPRIRSVLFEQLVDHGWSFAQWKDQLLESNVMPSHYRLDDKGCVVRSR
jgi:hypothetical protein